MGKGVSRKTRKRNQYKRGKTKPVKLKYEEPDELKRAPHSFVIHRGVVGRYIMELIKDFRKVMDPFTASSLKVQKKNSLKDFVTISSSLKVSHLVIFTNSSIGPNLRICRLPHGPTLMFRIHNYCLAKDVLSSIRRQMTNKKLFAHAPLVILNNFAGEGTHIQLMASVFQNMFPTINVTKVKLSDIRRCVMLNYNSETKQIDFRHYAIKAVPIGISRGVKKIVQSKIPNLAKYEDFSEFLIKPNVQSDSEMEDDPNSHVVVPQPLASRGNLVSQQSSIRLSELGPRMSLQLIKVEEGLLNGEVMFHELVHKTEEEKRIIRKRILEKRRLKEMRRAEQERNVQRKVQEKELHKKKSLEGMKRKKVIQDESENQPDDDDADYYRQQVGEEPDEDIFRDDRGAKGNAYVPRWKKRKLAGEDGEDGAENTKKRTHKRDVTRSKQVENKTQRNSNLNSKIRKKLHIKTNGDNRKKFTNKEGGDFRAHYKNKGSGGRGNFKKNAGAGRSDFRKKGSGGRSSFKKTGSGGRTDFKKSKSFKRRK